jgi:hypothetical protein
MIRDAVLHLTNEQPILIDLFAMPTPLDNAVLGRNVRTLDGKRPTYIERGESTFVFPYGQIRFIELRSGATPDSEGDEAEGAGEPEDLEIDEEFLQRVRDA